MFIRFFTVLAILSVPWPAVSGQPFPSETIRIVSPYAPGGLTDVLARLIASKLPEQIPGATVIVENRPGAAGSLGADYVAKSAPTGHTILLGTSTLTVEASFRTKLPYELLRDFIPLTDIANMSFAIIASPALPAKTFDEFVRYAKSHPGKLSYGTSGVGSTNHLTAELLKMKLGLEYLHVPYRGSGPAANATMSDEVQFFVDPPAPHIGLIQSGKLHVLAMTGMERDPAFPDVPTLAESGVMDFDVSVFLGFFLPAKTPADVVSRLNTAVSNILKMPDVRTKLEQMGLRAGGSSSANFYAKVDHDVKLWRDVVKTLSLPQNQ